ncbi:SusC/RagA family TonB-linked outer membrane protein [Desertivirga xinjiangensis]|uniref:SusC/RagA family TonB-linked outer membrane protein n=1 Tax=Desertivirga xinjiangensis TaxID=539206 RepID=UPI00210EB52F|nr:TonB-dependent receptor [Pedobacter xinjiangensis]
MKYFSTILKIFHFSLSYAYGLLIASPLLASYPLFAAREMSTEIKAPKQVSISGKVTDNKGEALIGVSVIIKGTNKGISTNVNGEFSIQAPEDATLIFSYLGYETKEIRLNGQRTLNVVLPESSSQLNEVVVVGYETVSRRDVTGSISSLSGRQIKDVPLSSAAEAITGRLAGVQVTTTEGAPGADVVVRIRGGGSITQDNSPIYIVDGIQVENALNVIAPQDIASIDVLKDASTTAIYGARGANGVVIITTKSGKPGKTTVNYTGTQGFRSISKTMDVLNSYDFVVWQYERSRAGQSDIDNFARNYGSTWDTLQVYRDKPFIDWQDEVFGRNAYFQSHNVSVNGGSKETTFNLSLTANDEDGILLQSGFKRYLANLKLDHRASDKFKITVTARYLDQEIMGAGTTTTGTRNTNRLRHSIVYRPFELPTAPATDEFDENYFLNSNQIQNPVILTEAEYRKVPSNSTNVSGSFSYEIIKGLTFKSTLGYDASNTRQELFYSKITPTARNFASLPVASITTQNNTTINNSNTLQYVKNDIKEHHDISLLVGQEIYQLKSKNNFVETRFFPADITAEKALANMSLGSPPSGSTQPRPTSSITPPNRIFSLFGQARYSYDDKFLGSFSLRADRSSKFRYDKGLLMFPSGTLAYRISQENFMRKFDWLSDAKIRVGYGVAGNNRIGDLLYMQLYGVTGEYALNHTVLPAFAPAALANEDLQWEKTVSQNLGFDLSFLRGRIQFTADIYKNKGNDLLLQVAIPSTTGYTSQIQNVGSTSNRGVEFQINGSVLQKRDFSWTSNFNIAFNRNKVESLGPITQQTRSSGWQGSDGADDYLVRVGDPVGLMYGFVTDGFYKVEDFDYANGVYTLKSGVPNGSGIFGVAQPGSLKLRDLNDDKLITLDNDRQVIGDANPAFTGGWHNQFNYKNFDMSVFVNFVYGNDIYNANKIEWTDGSFLNLNMLETMKNRWTTINSSGQVVTDPAALAALNENAGIWAPVRNQRYYLHSWAIEDGSFLRINNVTLGYTLPKRIIDKVKIAGLRVYATVNNLATITNYTGFDPEISTRRSDPLTQGVDFAGYPRSRTWVFGANISL